MTKLSRLKPLVIALMKNEITEFFVLMILLFPIPITIWLGSATLEDIGILPQSIAIHFVCSLPAGLMLVFLGIFILLKLWAKRN